MRFLFTCSTLLSAAMLCGALLSTPVRASVERSNEHARILLDALGPFEPITLDFFGVPGFTDRIPDIEPSAPERYRQSLIATRARLQQRLEAERDAYVRQDLEILIAAADRRIEVSDVSQRHLLPFVDAAESVFHGIATPLKSRNDDVTREAVRTRLKRFVGEAGAATPFVENVRRRYEEAMAKNPGLLAPFRGEVEDTLSSAPKFIGGVRESLAEAGIQDMEETMALLERQLNGNNDWIRQTILPTARADFREPRDLYALRLRTMGVDVEPEEMIALARLAFAEIRNEMQTIAALVAKDRGWSNGDYRAVLVELKREQLESEAILPAYRDVAVRIEEIIRRERICSLPSLELAIRLGTEAESASQPAPHMRPPPLVNNTGQRGTFVLPLHNPASPGGAAYDDFTFRAAMWTLTAHEGRPGHELQFASMVERGVSLARSMLAFNSVNVEGWALYAEAELKPYEPLEGQLIALQFRLVRAARAILDPMLNLGLISPDRAAEILEKEVGLSKPMVKQEVDRYTFRSPGQATTYLYGYMRLMQIRAEAELALGPRFDRMVFNDFILSQGLLPPELLRKAVMEQFVAEQQGK